MTPRFEKLYTEALFLLRNLSTEKGILASSIASDNYKRIWARDSVISGIAGILENDETIINGLKQSLLLLAEHQHALGMIPSNVSIEDSTVSYGSLVGRVDTNTWFIIGCCLYYMNTNDEVVWNQLLPSIKKSQTYLSTIELNGKGWIYTPLSGNWADEYPIQGYTLYDNCLYIWSKSLWQKVTNNVSHQLSKTKTKTQQNFWPLKSTNDENIYHKEAYSKAIAKSTPHFCSFILPGIYDTRFDASANALALLNFKLSSDQKKLFSRFLTNLKQELKSYLLPAFWPVIKTTDPEWDFLETNYAYQFKNKPYHFHNGGIWPVWLGLFCLGLVNNDMYTESEQLIKSFEEVTKTKAWDFQEYISSDNLQLNGKSQMGFTASGVIFMHHALKKEHFKHILGL